MLYSLVGVIGILVTIIVNFDLLFSKKDNSNIPGLKYYRLFLMTVIMFFFFDFLWGLLDSLKLRIPLIIDTYFFFIYMISTVLFWTKYVIEYLEGKGFWSKLLIWSVRIFAIFLYIVLIINIFKPVVFEINENCEYKEYFFRNLILYLQIFLYLCTSVYTLVYVRIFKKKKSTRYNTIGLCGFALMVFIIVQIFFPLAPIFSAGYIVSSCVLYSFVIGEEKKINIEKLKESYEREKKQRAELGSARILAYTDPLTGIRNKLSFLKWQETFDNTILEKRANIAIAVFDLNGLKNINDTLGHEQGDQYIISATKLICDYFKHSPVYRIGGDEFVSVVMGEDYINRDKLMNNFQKLMIDNTKTDDVVIAMGMVDHNNNDFVQKTFEIADKEMYKNKQKLKELL